MKLWVEWGEHWPVFYVRTEPDDLSHEVEVPDDLLERHRAAGTAWRGVQAELRAALVAAGQQPPD